MTPTKSTSKYTSQQVHVSIFTYTLLQNLASLAAPARKVYVLAIRSLALRDTTAGVVGVVMATDDLSSILQTVINDTATNESVYYLVEDTGYIAGSTGDDMVSEYHFPVLYQYSHQFLVPY